VSDDAEFSLRCPTLSQKRRGRKSAGLPHSQWWVGSAESRRRQQHHAPGVV